MKKQPDDGLDVVHTRLAVRMKEARELALGQWTMPPEPITSILAQCPVPECEECSRIMCPYGDPLHFHHDGCPTCSQDPEGDE